MCINSNDNQYLVFIVNRIITIISIKLIMKFVKMEKYSMTATVISIIMKVITIIILM